MCRTGGRRCDGSRASSRATQNTRQAVSRARKALRQAKANGDATATTAAQQRLDAARAAHQRAREAMLRNETARHSGDVTTNRPTTTSTQNTVVVVTNTTNAAAGSTVYQAAVINGPVVFTGNGPDFDLTTPDHGFHVQAGYVFPD